MKIGTEQEINRLLEFQEKDYPELYQAAKNENIIIFIGAGVAKLYGIPLWTELAKELIDCLRKNSLINFAEENVLYKESDIDPRKVISICYEICKNNQKNIYEKSIKDILSKNLKSKEMQSIYDKIFALKAISYLTTNMDLGIFKYFINKAYYYKPKIYNLTLEEDRRRIEEEKCIFKDGIIFYLHGNMNNINEAIFPIKKYLEFYSEKNEFLNKFFANLRESSELIIFIGYGLKEWDIIERIYKMKTQLKLISAYILSPIFSSEIKKFNLETYYYGSFGVRPIPYIIDNEGYNKLEFVLENLGKTINKNIPSPYNIYDEIERLK